MDPAVLHDHDEVPRGVLDQLDVSLGLFLAAVLLAAAARRVGAPYPVFLAVGGAALAFVPGAPSFTVRPDLALAQSEAIVVRPGQTFKRRYTLAEATE